MNIITRRYEWGVDWASDREVINGHFKLRYELAEDERGVQIEEDEAHRPMILSM